MKPIEELFTYHAPRDDQPQRYAKIREKAAELARTIDALCPDSSDKLVAIRKVREAAMTANAAIAINWPERKDAQPHPHDPNLPLISGGKL